MGKLVLRPMYYLLRTISTPISIGIIFTSLLILSPIGFYNLSQAQTESEPIELEEIVVTPGKFTVQSGTDASLSLSKEGLDLFPLIDNDVFRAAHIFPGVTANDFSARFNLRGGEKDEIVVRLDGMELFEPYHLQDFGGAVSIIDLGVIHRADLFMGGFPAEYGDKMSGVFDITTKTGNRDKFAMNLGIDLINAHALLEGPLSDKGSWLISARRGYVDLILALMDADEDLRPQYADLYSKIAYDLTDKDKLTFNALYAWDDNFIDADDDADDLDSTYHNAMFWTKWRHFYSESVWSDLFIFNNLATRDRRVGYYDTLGRRAHGRSYNSVDKRDFGFLGAKGELTAHLGETHTIRGGLEWRWSRVEYDYVVRLQQQITRQFILSRCSLCTLVDGSGLQIKGYLQDEWQLQPKIAKVDGSGSQIKGYLQDEWQLHPKLALNIGGRYLFQNYRRNDIRKYEISPRIALAVEPVENLTLRAAWGLYHQPIDLMTIPVETFVTDVGRAGQAIHYILGAEYASGKNFMVRAEGYYKVLTNLAGQIQDFGRQAQIIAPADSGHAKGFDLFGAYALSDRLMGSLGYAFLITKAKEEDLMYGRPLFGEDFYRDFDQRHTIILNGSYQIALRWHLHLSWRFHTGNPTTPLEHTLVRYSDDYAECERGFGEYNTDRLPPYHSLDLRFTKTSEYKSWMLNWYVQILNLYNRSNVHERVFSEVHDEATGELAGCEVSDEPLFPILPTLGVSATF